MWAGLSPVVGHEQAGRRPGDAERGRVQRALRHGDRDGADEPAPAAGFPLTLQLKSLTLRTRAWVKIRQVRTLSTRRLGRKLGRVDPAELDRLVEGLNEIMAA